jgi:hypothetical protein
VQSVDDETPSPLTGADEVEQARHEAQSEGFDAFTRGLTTPRRPNRARTLSRPISGHVKVVGGGLRAYPRDSVRVSSLVASEAAPTAAAQEFLNLGLRIPQK